MSAAAIPPADFHVFGDFFIHLGAALSHYVNNVAVNIILEIKSVVNTLLAIYVCLWGWSMMRGSINEPVGDGVGRMVRLSIIVTIALNIDFYNDYLSNFLLGAPDALATAISHNPGSAGTADGNYLDSLLNQMFDFGNKYKQQGYENGGMIPDYGLIFLGLALQAVGVVAAGYGGFLMALSKISLSVILAIGPIFVLLLIFEGTKKFFDAWLGQAINAIFVMALTAATLKLILNLLQDYLTHNGATQMPGAQQAVEAVVLAVIGILVLLQVPSISSALSGGVAVGTLGAVSWAAKKSSAGSVKFGKAVSAAAPAVASAAMKTAGSTVRGLNSIRPSNIKETATAAVASAQSAGSSAKDKFAAVGKSVTDGAKADYKATAGAARAVGSVSMAAIRKVTGTGGNSVSQS